MIHTFTKGPIARGTVRTSLVFGLRLMVQAGNLLLVARILGPGDFGAFAGFAALAVLLGAFSTFGTDLLLLEGASRDTSSRDTILPFAVPTTLICGTALLLLYLLITHTLFPAASRLTLTVLLPLGVAELVLQPLLAQSRMDRIARSRVARSQLVAVMPLALRMAAAGAIWLLYLPNPLATYAWAYAVVTMLALAIAIWPTQYRLPGPRAWRLPRLNQLARGASFAFMSTTVAGPAELDKTLAFKLLAPGAAGVYSAAARVVGACTMPVTAMMLSALPRLFRESTTVRERSARLTRWTCVAALGYGLVLSLLLWLAAPMISWIFGHGYSGIEHAIHWLCLVIPGMALRVVSGQTLMSLGRIWLRAVLESLGTVILALAAVALVPLMKLAGLAVAVTLAEWSIALIGLLYLRVFFATIPEKLSD